MTRGGPLIIIAFLVPLTLDVGPSPVFLSRILIVRKILLLLYSKIKNANSQYHIRISNINIQYEYQIYESKLIGADCILLIASILSDQQLEEFVAIAKTLELDYLIEVHDLSLIHI